MKSIHQIKYYFVFPLTIWMLWLSNSVLAQQAELVTEPIYVDFSKSEESQVTILFPHNLIEKTRVFGNVGGGTERSVQIKGKVFDHDGIKNVTVNDKEANLFPDGLFEARVDFDEYSEREINIAVVDGTGEVTAKRYVFQNKAEEIADVFPLVTPEESKFYALIIAVEQYDDDEIIDLDNPVKDADILAQLLNEQYLFNKENIFRLNNPAREEIIVQLDVLSSKLSEDDNLLIYYAGHGYWDEGSNLGYWIPKDGKKRSKTNWIRNSALHDYVKEIKTRNTLLIADACFSGGIFKTRELSSLSTKAMNSLYTLPSRKAMTSGFLTTVPDKSVFNSFLIKRLKENTKKYLSSHELYLSLRDAVINNTYDTDNLRPTVPQYGTLKNTGDEGGDFIFIKRN